MARAAWAAAAVRAWSTLRSASSAAITVPAKASPASGGVDYAGYLHAGLRPDRDRAVAGGCPEQGTSAPRVRTTTRCAVSCSRARSAASSSVVPVSVWAAPVFTMARSASAMSARARSGSSATETAFDVDRWSPLRPLARAGSGRPEPGTSASTVQPAGRCQHVRPDTRSVRQRSGCGVRPPRRLFSPSAATATAHHQVSSSAITSTWSVAIPALARARMHPMPNGSSPTRENSETPQQRFGQPRGDGEVRAHAAGVDAETLADGLRVSSGEGVERRP